MTAAPWRGTGNEVTRAHRGTVVGVDGQQGGWGLRLLYRDVLEGASSCFVAFYQDVRAGRGVLGRWLLATTAQIGPLLIATFEGPVTTLSAGA